LVYVDSNLANPNLNASLTESNVWLSLHACNVRDSKGLPILIGIGIRFGNRMHHDCEGLADSLFIICSMLSTCKVENEERDWISRRDLIVWLILCVCVCVCGVVAAIFLATSSSRPRADVTYCIHVLARRIAKTHTWTVSRSTLLGFIMCLLIWERIISVAYELHVPPDWKMFMIFFIIWGYCDKYVSDHNHVCATT
jgi:hypothetical protein